MAEGSRDREANTKLRKLYAPASASMMCPACGLPQSGGIREQALNVQRPTPDDSRLHQDYAEPWRAEGREQKAEGRGQKAEGGRPKAEGVSFSFFARGRELS